jgi:hypothetical protein
VREASVSLSGAGSGRGGGGRSASFCSGGRSGVSRIVNPVFQRQISEAGEVAGVARDERKAVAEGRATYHQVEVIDGTASAAQAGFLSGVMLKAVRNG